jgi:hypothetical protein
MKKPFSILVALSLVPVLSTAQSKDWGRVSASLESTHHLYVEDKANGFSPSDLLQLNEDGIYATNNYLKIDYFKGRFSAGTQLEGYFPSTVGYPFPENKLSISNLYVSWRDDSYSVTAGTFYEQLGSGLLFRSWEDRALGMNNAMLGARATYNWDDKISAKAFWGIPRLGKLSEYGMMMGMEKGFFGLGLASDVNIAGADLSVSLSNMLGWDAVALSLEGSVINKHEALSDALLLKGCRSNNVGWSARANLDVDGFYAKAEYVDAGKQLVNQFFDAERGNAQLIELGYNSRGLGVSFTGRRLERMTQQIYTSNLMYASAANVISYCPAMTTQYTYMLTALHPYNPEIGTNKLRAGEIGGQLDAFYNFRRGTALGGKRGMKVHANFSTYYALNETGGTKGSEFLYRDFSFDVEKQWTKKFKTTLMYSMQDYDKHEKNYADVDTYIGLSHIVVADLLYKWTPKLSTRLELQYLASDDYQKDWMAALLEVSFAPHWSVFASDMYNHGDSRLHYYNAGLSYVYGKIRVAAGYGRYRAGFICSGGVCREIPAYTGANLTLTASF